MELSLTEAAHLLGKTERQIRYLLRNGSLRGRKDGPRWLVDRDSLPLTEAQRAQLQQRVQAAETAFQRAVAPAKKATDERRPFSVSDLDAFRIGIELLAILRQQQRHPAAELLATCLGEVGCGCHAFESRTKQRHFTAARDAAARAVVALWIGGSGTDGPAPAVAVAPADVAARLEAELIPKLSGLVAAQERRSQRGRFDHGRSFLRDDREEME
jgi:hypothetical protein